jgi:GNAT superfamily N-acetyltransferase
VTPGDVVLEERLPTPAELRRLFDAVGWYGELPDDDRQLAAALDRCLYAVCAVAAGETVGCARLIGDGAVYLYIQDVILLPAFQRLGVGDRLMRSVMTWLDEHCPANASVALFAAPGKDEFYKRYGFAPRPADEPGMAQRWHGPGCWRKP